jgi:hypothetical protein
VLLIYENAAIYLPIQMLQLQLIRHFFKVNEFTFNNIERPEGKRPLGRPRCNGRTIGAREEL